MGSSLSRRVVKQLTLFFSISTDNVGVRRDGSLDSWVVEMDDGSIILEEIDLFNCRNIGYTELLQSGSELLVIGGRRLVDGLLLSADRTLSTGSYLQILPLWK